MVQLNIALAQKVEELLQDEDTKQWIVTLNSESAKINYKKHLAEYLLHQNITISQLIENFKKDEPKEAKNKKK